MKCILLTLSVLLFLGCSKTSTENKIYICEDLTRYHYQLGQQVLAIPAAHKNVWNALSSVDQKRGMKITDSCMGAMNTPIQVLSLSLTQRELNDGKSARKYIQSGEIDLPRGIVGFKVSADSTLANCSNAPDYQRTCRRGIFLDDLGLKLTVNYFFNPEWKEGYFVSPDEWPWEVYPRENPVKMLEQVEVYVRSLIVSTNSINP